MCDLLVSPGLLPELGKWALLRADGSVAQLLKDDEALRVWQERHTVEGEENVSIKLRLVRPSEPVNSEMVIPAVKDEGHMKTAEEASRSWCKCGTQIGEQRPFYRVNGRCYHAECARSA